MGYIALESLVADMTPEQKIFMSNVYQRFDIGSKVANKKIIDIRPFAYAGGTGFAVYSATTIYALMQCNIMSVLSLQIVEPEVNIYDETNNVYLKLRNSAVVYNGVNISYSVQPVAMNNFYFSRMLMTGYSLVNMIGYQITLGTV